MPRVVKRSARVVNADPCNANNLAKSSADKMSRCCVNSCCIAVSSDLNAANAAIAIKLPQQQVRTTHLINRSGCTYMMAAIQQTCCNNDCSEREALLHVVA